MKESTETNLICDPRKRHPLGGDARRTGRRSIRLKEYDYSQAGGYFVTMCVRNRECLFGKIIESEMKMNGFGEIVKECWDEIPNNYRNTEIDEFVVMPNHIHGIIMILDDLKSDDVVGAIHELPLQMDIIKRRQMLLPKIIGRFKMNSAKRINEIRNSPGVPVWQRNYFEHVIRTEKELNHIREYIINNPTGWPKDEENIQLR
jgi:REP element-mobilizing transposase RayT